MSEDEDDPQHPWNLALTQQMERCLAEAHQAMLERLRCAVRDGNLGALEFALLHCADSPLPQWLLAACRT